MWTCPKCGAKVDPGFDVCWQCGTARDGTEDPTFRTADQAPVVEDVPAAEASASGLLDASGLVACYQAPSLMEARFLANELNERGIEATCDEQDMQDTLGGWSGNPHVYCHESDLAAARAFLAEYERKKAGHDPLET